MRHPAANMDSTLMKNETRFAAQRVKDFLKTAEKLRDDVHYEQRVRVAKCPACYYFASHVVAGAAMTTRACMCCNEDQTYSSTSTDKMCLDCAVKHDLCRHCGGDMDMDINRSKWPSADVLAEPGEGK